MNKYYILVICYKETLYSYEHLSLLRIIDYCIKTNRLDRLILIIPDNFDIDSFVEKYINKYTLDNFGQKFYLSFYWYPSICFSSVNSYNNMLMLSQNFYGDFGDDADYLLIYHLDAYIFNDQLDYFLNKNYDYIGGYYLPIFADNMKYNNFINLDEKNLIMNGGVSLRKIKYCLNIINNEYDNLLNGCEFNNVFSFINEDSVFSQFYKTKVTAIESIKFSLNWSGAECYWAIIDYEYPFCCHGINNSKFLMKLVEKFNEENNLNYKEYISNY